MKQIMAAAFREFVFAHNFKMQLMLYGQISIDGEVMSGTPVFAGTRVPVQTLFDYMEGGDDLNEFLNDFPSVTKESAVCVRNDKDYRIIITFHVIRYLQIVP